MFDQLIQIGRLLDRMIEEARKCGLIVKVDRTLTTEIDNRIVVELRIEKGN